MHDYEKIPTIDPVQASSVSPEKLQDLDPKPAECADDGVPRQKKQKIIDFSDVDTKRKSDNMYVKVAVRFLQRVSLLLLGYALCYLDYSLILPIILISTLVWYENAKSKKKERIQKKVFSSSMTKQDILNVVKDLPSWVNFPDRERAEWLNEIIHQLWPNVNSYIVKYCRGKIQTNIRKKFDSFRFEDIDFGNTPPKIDGIKVYHQAMTKDSIIIDFEIFYDGDCSINFSMSGAQIGRIKDFQMGVEMRVVLKPLLFKPPLIGGIQLFFLNIPDIDFELEGISGIPGFSYLIRLKVEEIINKKLVFPNKITKRFTKSIEAAELKSIEAEGVLRVHVFEARDLEKKDVTGKSDPYVILNVGAQEFKTQVIKRELNPQWDYYCEFIILDPAAQQLYFKLFDQDNFNEDEFLGSGAIDISQVIKPGKTDQWFNLENVKHGKIHFRFSWLVLTADKNAIDAAAEETKLLKIENIHTALLTIYIEAATNLPKIKAYKKPDPYVILTVGKNQTKSRTKKHTCNPIWDQGFYLLVRNPMNDSLIVTIIDKHSDSTLDKMVYSIRDLLEHPDMQISKEEFVLHLNPESRIVISLQLRILHNAQFEAEDSETDSDDEPVKESNSLSLDNLTKEKLVNDSPKTSRQSSVEEQMEQFKRSEVSASGTSPTYRAARFSQRLDDRGRIELTMDYSELRQKLLVTVHRVANLPLKNPSDIPDPYVKLKLDGPGNSPVKYRTKVIVDSCDPEYEETFEYLLSISELPHQKLIISVKNKKMFNSRVLGQKIIELKILQLFQEPIRAWYDLHEEEVSD